MKESGIDWIGQMPEEWESGKVKYFSKISAGATPDRNNLLFWNGDINWMSSGEVNQEIVKYTAETITNLALKKSSTKLLPIGTVMLAMNGQGKTKGTVAILAIETASNQSLASFIVDGNRLNNQYLYYFFKAGYSYIRGLKGEDRDGLNLQLVSNITVLLFDIKEQQKIADFLDKKTTQLDKVKSLLEEQIQKLYAYRASLIYETVTKGLDNTVPMKDSGIEWIGQVPEGWGVTKFKYLGDVKQGLTYSPSDVVDKDEGILVLRSGNIQNGSLDFNNNVYVKTKVVESIVLRKNDILITARNGSPALIGKNAIIDTDIKATFGAFMMVFRANKSLFAKFAYYLMNVSFSFYRTFFTTSTVNQLTAAIFNGIEVPLPSVSEQQRIADFLDNKTYQIDQLIQIKNKQIENINKQRQTLIYDYVTGKRRV